MRPVVNSKGWAHHLQAGLEIRLVFAGQHHGVVLRIVNGRRWVGKQAVSQAGIIHQRVMADLPNQRRITSGVMLPAVGNYPRILISDASMISFSCRPASTHCMMCGLFNVFCA